MDTLRKLIRSFPFRSSESNPYAAYSNVAVWLVASGALVFWLVTRKR